MTDKEKRLLIIQRIDEKRKEKAHIKYLRDVCNGKSYAFCKKVIIPDQLENPNSSFNAWLHSQTPAFPTKVDIDVPITDNDWLKFTTMIVFETILEIFPESLNVDGICSNEK